MNEPAEPALGSRAVQQALEEAGVEFEWRVCATPTRTAAEAAAALGVGVDTIVKSLVFMAGDWPVLVLVAGQHRADPVRLHATLGRAVRPARGKEVMRATGFPPGEVPPCGHRQPLLTLCDASLLRPERIWAAGGAPAEVFGIRPDDLVRVTSARLVELAEDAAPPG